MSRESYKEEETMYDELGNEVTQQRKKVKEVVVDEYPCLEVVGWKDIYYDPRYIRLEDMPAVIDNKERVRMSFFTQDKKKYMNIDELEEYTDCNFDTDPQSYNQRVYSITGIMPTTTGKIDKNSLNVKKYYGYYDLK
jgi:hypothetical protein